MVVVVVIFGGVRDWIGWDDDGHVAVGAGVECFGHRMVVFVRLVVAEVGVLMGKMLMLLALAASASASRGSCVLRAFGWGCSTLFCLPGSVAFGS